MFRRFFEIFGMGGECPSIPKVSPKHTHERMLNDELMLVDVRQPEEWVSEGSPKGANQVAFQCDDFVDQVIGLVSHNRETPVAVCCRSGMRSEKAARLLQASGFTNVVNVEGGMMRWAAEKLPIV